MIPVKWFLGFLVILTIGLALSGVVSGDWIRVACAGLLAVFALLINWLYGGRR